MRTEIEISATALFFLGLTLFLALVLARVKEHFYALKYQIFMKAANPKL